MDTNNVCKENLVRLSQGTEPCRQLDGSQYGVERCLKMLGVDRIDQYQLIDILRFFGHTFPGHPS